MHVCMDTTETEQINESREMFMSHFAAFINLSQYEYTIFYSCKLPVLGLSIKDKTRHDGSYQSMIKY